MDQVSTTLRILSKVERRSFVGRSTEFQRLMAHGRGESLFPGLSVLAPPGAGSSELLSQVYDELFSGQNDVIPFYYRVTASDVTGRAAAVRFVNEFRAQATEFRSQEPRLIDGSPEEAEISLATSADATSVHRAIGDIHADNNLDERSFIRHCIGSPLRAAAAGSRVFVMIDDIHEAMSLQDGGAFLDDISRVFDRSPIPVIFSGHRRFLYGRTTFPALRIEHLTFPEAGKLVQQLADDIEISINDQTRDLIAVQLGFSPRHITSLLRSASEVQAELTSFAATQQIYTDEIFGGRIGRRFDHLFDRLSDNAESKASLIRLVKETSRAEPRSVSIAKWQEGLGISDVKFRAVVDELYHHEIINVDSGQITIDETDTVLADYIDASFSLAEGEKPRALVVGESTAKNVHRAPQLMARFYRKNSALGLLELLKAFDGRQISPALIDYARYRDELKGVSRDRVQKAIKEDNARFPLPQFVFSAHTSAYYSRLNEICETERSVTAIGVSEGGNKSEIVWIAAEIDSKLEATRELTEFWCDRLEMVAITCNFTNYKIWLIAPEGFTPDALDVLNQRGGVGSSRAQAELLAGLIIDKAESEASAAANVYEFIVPMGDDTEMIAAHTVEEIAKHHKFPSKAINQIKTALVEACINATEHSLSPDRRIYQTFRVDDEKLTITVANRGVRLGENALQEDRPDNERRGWGLKLIKGLMDEVRLENSDDGTRITMVKNMRRGVQSIAS